MKVLEINLTYKIGSTGKIVSSLCDIMKENTIDSYILCAYSIDINDTKIYQIDSFLNYNYANKMNIFVSRITGRMGYNHKLATKRVLKWIDGIKPDIIHLHNIHGNWINIKLLFEYIKKNNIPVIWTLHDCWAFTGRCSHFTLAKCDKWKTACYSCKNKKTYPITYIFDFSKKMYADKKKWFRDINNINLVTPSKWLADLVKQSFLKDYPVKVINNGIDLSVFKPTESNFRERYNIPAEKYILLGVAFGWGARKGLDVFIELSKHLPDNYQIVLVGTNDKTDKQLPKNIISIHRTQNQAELAEIYTAADLFVNPTREENYPTVNMESLACGTPVLTFRTGGSPEIIDETCGSVVDCDDIDALESEIKRICTEKPYSKDACLNRAKAFDMNERFQEYIELYERQTN